MNTNTSKILYLSSLLVLSTVVNSSSTWALESDDVNDLMKKGLEATSGFRYDEAISYFDKVLEIEPDNVDALNNKGVSLGNLQQYKEAISYFDKVLEIEPDNVDALNNKGAALIKLGKYLEAIASFDKVLEIEPDNAVATSNKKVVVNRNNAYRLSEGEKEKFLISVEIQIKDSEGHLVTYIETNRITVPNQDLLDIVLDTAFLEKSTITKNGQQYEMTKIKSLGKFKGHDTAASITGFLWGQEWLLYAVHDGYPLVEGDTTSSIWTIIRTIK